jgi:hypothetical protein
MDSRKQVVGCTYIDQHKDDKMFKDALMSKDHKCPLSGKKCKFYEVCVFFFGEIVYWNYGFKLNMDGLLGFEGWTRRSFFYHVELSAC